MPSKNPTTTISDTYAGKELFTRRIFAAPRPANTWVRDIARKAEELQAKVLGLMLQPAQGFVYIVRCTVTERTKIGKSHDLVQRMRSLQAVSPTQLELVAIAPGGKREEEHLHLDVSRYRLHGEWFDLPERELVRILQMFEGELEAKVARLRANAAQRERRRAKQEVEFNERQTPEYLEKLDAVAAAMDRRGRS